MMKNLVLAVALAACGSKQPAPVSNAGTDPDPPGPVEDTRTELERRRDDACDTLGPRMTQCAVEDAKKELAAGRVKQKDFDANTSPDVQRKNTEEFIKTNFSPKALSERYNLRVKGSKEIPEPGA